MTASHQDQAERERNRSAADAFLALRDAAVQPALPLAQVCSTSQRLLPSPSLLKRHLAVPMMRHSSAMTESVWCCLDGALDLRSHRRFATLCTGDRLQVDLRELMGSRLFHFGVWEPNITALLVDTLRTGDVFCDAGASIGYYTVLASRLVGPGGRVVAIEPSATALRRLRYNVALNGLTNVRVVSAAVAAERGRLPLAPGSGWAFQAEVDSLPLTQILTRPELARLRLLKIDIEGGEGPVLAHILQNLAAFGTGTEILADLAVDAAAPGVADASDLAARFQAAGFRARAIANACDLQSYLEFRTPEPPQDLPLPLTAQTDVLFSRRLLAGAG